MEQPRYSADEIADRGRSLYEQDIRSKVEPANIGKYLIIDIESGDYVMDTDEMAAMQRALVTHPEGLFYIMRIGYRALGRIGLGPEVTRSE